MFDKLAEKRKKLEDKIKLANSTEKEIAKMDYKEKQKYYKAKASLGKIFHQKGTYKKEIKKEDK